MSRSDQRGATLTMFAIAISLVVGAIGGAHFLTARTTYRLVVLRERGVKARAAADAGVAIAAARARRGGIAGDEGEERVGDALVRWEIAAAGGARATVRASGSAGAGEDAVTARLVAEIDLGGPDGAPRILEIGPE